MKILIVDDTQENVTMISDMLQMIGHEPVSANNGYRALDILAQQPIQFAIVDWMMPEMDGIELIKRIRAQFSERYTYIIMLTARNSGDDVVTGLENGADDYVAKPFYPREMRARIQSGERLIDAHNKLAASLAHMENLATRDHLTKLYNRRRFTELAEAMLLQNQIVSVLMLDVDHFKGVNDRYGHLMGDTVLRHIASICSERTGEAGIIGRYGGEEFVGMLPGYTTERARSLAEGLRHAIHNQPMKLQGEWLTISVSIGVATTEPGESLLLSDLIGQADGALYRAKATGRNRVVQADNGKASDF